MSVKHSLLPFMKHDNSGKSVFRILLLVKDFSNEFSFMPEIITLLSMTSTKIEKKNIV